MNSQQSKASTSSSSPSTAAALPIRRASSAPRLSKNLRPVWTADNSALVRSPISTPDSSSGDEAVWIKPKGRAQFECNICFDAARDPVVTQCGHLYCWPCLHQVSLPLSVLFCLFISGYPLLALPSIRLVRHASLDARFHPSFLFTDEALHLRRDRPPPPQNLSHPQRKFPEP